MLTIFFQITLPRVAYEEIKEGEKRNMQQLKAEQARANRLEKALADMEIQCNAHAERAKTATTERNR